MMVQIFAQCKFCNSTFSFIKGGGFPSRHFEDVCHQCLENKLEHKRMKCFLDLLAEAVDDLSFVGKHKDELECLAKKILSQILKC